MHSISYLFLLISLAAVTFSTDCSCGSCQVVDCDEGEKACREIVDGEANCVSGATDWICELDSNTDCKSSECSDICDKSQCYQANCGISDQVCFHHSSIITYKGKDYTLEQLSQGMEPECVVPHVPTATGVKFITACGHSVQVTDTHLVATENGFTFAHMLKEGMSVHIDPEGKTSCVVESVERSLTPEQYFGLNCLHSEVLVNGVRASTFGDLHLVPAIYMKLVGQVVGVQAASIAGAYFANVYHYLADSSSRFLRRSILEGKT